MEEKGKSKERIRSLKRRDREYPGRLREIPGAPAELYLLGRLPEEDRPAVAIIGARDCSEYGRYVASGLGAALARNGIQVISGMARGIDGIGQEAALDAGGSSFAVLGSGVDVCYPAGNRRLYEKLKSRGGILSEYPPGTPPLSHHFPPRNRIVSGLADVVVVVEAREKSGTLITVDMALEQGREVYVVPGRVTDPLSVGCNRLLKLGAGLLLDLGEFLEEVWQICESRRPGTGLVRTEVEPCPADGEGGRSRAVRAEPGAADGERNRSRAVRAEPEAAGGEGSRKSRRTEPHPAGGTGWEAAGNPAADRLSAEAPVLAALYRALDFTPGSVEQIRARLPEAFQEEQLSVHLIRLCLEGLAVQVSPGQFGRKRN